MEQNNGMRSTCRDGGGNGVTPGTDGGLREQQEWFRATLGSIGDAVIATDTRGRVTFMNQPAQALTGYSPGEAMGRPVADIFRIVREETGAPAEIPVARVLAEGKVVGLANHTTLIARSGKKYAIADSAAPIRSDDGDIIGVVMVFQDITARKQAETAFRELAAEYEAIFNGTQNPLFLVDVLPAGGFRFRRVNAALERVTGLAAERLAGADPLQAAGETAGRDMEQHFQRCAESGAPLVYLAERQFPRGNMVVYVTLTPLVREGRTGQIVGSLQDLTPLRVLEKELRASEEKYRTLFAQANAGISLHPLTADGQNGPFREVNGYLCRRLGYSGAELQRMTPDEIGLTAPEDGAARAGEMVPGWQITRERDVKMKGGGTIPLEVNAHVITLQGEKMMLCISHDISERRQAQATLQHRLAVERAVAKVGRILNSGQPADFDEIVSVLGQAVGASRSYIYRFRDELRFIDKTAEWCAAGVASKRAETQNLDMQNLPWLKRQMLRRQPVAIPAVQELPESAARERELLTALGSKAVLVVPCALARSAPEGMLGFVDTNGPRQWLAEDAGLLLTVSEMVAAYIGREKDQARIKYLSFHDKLTDLYNKAFLEEEMARLDTGRQLPISLIVGDLNGLKFINDTFGHQEGDRLLVQAARLLRASCRQEDIVARWGGDEFVVLLPQTGEEAAQEIVSRIQSAFGAASGGKVQLNIALGAATKAAPEQPMRRVIKEAEDRMYRNKLLEGQSFRSNILASLGKTLWERSCETEEHARRLQALALALGRAVWLSASQLDELKLLALLHDIGKVGIPDEILTRRGPLTAEDREIVMRHPEIGYRVAGASPELASIAYAILSHHEHWDGSGYPQGLKGTAIPLIARINAVVDAYDVMTHTQPYKAAVSQAEALAELQRCSGTQFDPELVEAFVHLMRSGEFNPD